MRLDARLAGCLMVMCSLSATAQVSPTEQAERAAVRAAVDSGNREYVDAFARSDQEAVARLYAPDGSRMLSDGEYAHGQVAIAAVVQDLLSRTGSIAVSLQTLDLWVVGDLAYETGRWQYVFTPRQKTRQSIGGKYVTTWKRQRDGRWRIFADVGVPHTDFAS